MLNCLTRTFVAACICFSASAEDLFVRPNGGSYGAEDGSDWDNAFNGFSDVVWGASAGQLGAGDTLWIAAGTYTQSVVIKGSGTSGNPITLKRATASDSAATSATGWSAGYDGQVTIDTGAANVIYPDASRDYITIDGQTEYGIKVNCAEGANSGGVFWGFACDYWEIKYIELDGPADTTSDYNYTSGVRGMDLTPGASSDNLLISHCKIHGFSTLIYVFQHSNVTIEYCVLKDARSSNVAYHTNVIYAQGETCDNLVVRYNDISNYNAEGVYHAGPAEGVRTGCQVYGNVFHDGGTTARAFEADLQKYDTGYVEVEFHNNTIVNMSYGIVGANANFNSSSFTNNIFYAVTLDYEATNLSHDYNLYDGTTSESNGVGSASDPFVNYAGGDYTIGASSSAKDLGADLGATYSTDLLGATRGSDGTWDIGAYEYSGTDTTPPAFSSASVATDGTTLTVVFGEATVVGSGGSGGMTISVDGGGAQTATYSSGSGTTSLVYTVPTVYSGETVTVSYTNPGDGLEDAAGNDVATISAESVTNSSTQTEAPAASGAGTLRAETVNIGAY